MRPASNHKKNRPTGGYSKSPTLRRWAFWCGRWDLNPYALRHTPLKRTCLPIPALPLDPANLILSYFAGSCKYFFTFIKAFFPAVFNQTIRHKVWYMSDNYAIRFSHGAPFPDMEYQIHCSKNHPKCRHSATH